LHAAAHWGQKEACEMLVEEFCDMDMKNYVVGNYQFIKFTEVRIFPLHSENLTVNKIYKCMNELCVMTSITFGNENCKHENYNLSALFF
jgi:hypothetical protein